MPSRASDPPQRPEPRDPLGRIEVVVPEYEPAAAREPL